MATNPITIRGRHFMNDDKRFILRGVCYQPHTKRPRFTTRNYEDYDPLRDERLPDLLKDIELFKVLRINTIIVYTILSELSHDACLTALANAGIYVFANLSEPKAGINRLSPRQSYTRELLDRYASKTDDLSRHVNVVGVILANEILNIPETTPAAGVVRAMVRDLKTHMSNKAQLSGQRILPVGISDSSVIAQRTESIDYYTAGLRNGCIDFYTYNDYRQCKNPDTHWDDVAARFSGRTLPIFVSEYGCNAVRPRLWQETRGLYARKTLSVLSGGMAYDFMEGANQYGLVSADREPLEDFENYRKELAALPDDALLGHGHDTGEENEMTAERLFPPQSETWWASADIPQSLT